MTVFRNRKRLIFKSQLIKQLCFYGLTYPKKNNQKITSLKKIYYQVVYLIFTQNKDKKLNLSMLK